MIKNKFTAFFMVLAAITVLTSFSASQKAVQDFASSVAFDSETDTVRFTIPKGLSSKNSFYIHISGRTKMGDSGSSFHLFEDESENNNWEPEKTYTHEFGKGALLEALILVGTQEQGKSQVSNEIQIQIDENGTISIAK